MRTTAAAVALLLLVTPAAGREAVRATGGMVVSHDADATRVGVAVLRAGGTAFDAAVAVHFALAVTAPHAGNLGGGGFLLLYDARSGKVRALDCREAAPAAATEKMYQNAAGEVVRDRSLVGYLAVGVPGSVRGMAALHRAHGTLPWKRLLAPAVRLAADGFRLSPALAARVERYRAQLQRFEDSKRAFFKRDGSAYPAGELLRQPALARALRLIQAGGDAPFYEGALARELVARMAAAKGLITAADLKGYRAIWREPVHFRYRGHTIYSMPPPSSGGLVLAGILMQLERYDLRALGFGGWRTIHLMVESMRRAYADRARHMGDPAFHPVPRRGLLSPAYWRARRLTIDPYRATPSQKVRPGKPTGREKQDTTHYSIVDRWGNAVSATTSLNSNFGSKATVSGYLLNNTMDDFSARPGTPNQFGLVGGKANRIEPRKRPLSSMTPTLVFDDARKLRLVLGSPGGSRIITATAQVILNTIDHRMPLQQAVDARRVHHQWLPDAITLERRGLYSPDTLHELKRAGHALRRRASIGGVQAVGVRHQGGQRTLLGAVDPRRGGLALGLGK